MLAFTGSATAQHKFAVIGFPWDFGASLGRPGARYAPAEIRRAAVWHLNRIRNQQVWDLEGDAVVDLSPVVIEDRGDVPIAAHDRALTFQRAEAAAREALEGGFVPIVLGGDHSISLPPIAALASVSERIGIIQIDAHLDLVDDSPVQGRYSQSSQIRRALELEGASPRRLVQIGLRGLNYPEYAAYCEQQGITQITAPAALEAGVEQVADRALEVAGADGAAIYLTLDIDALDPSVAPGAGHLEPGGLPVAFVSRLLRRLAPRVAAFDIAEVNPLFDVQGMTSNLAAKLLFDFILGRIAGRGGAGHE